MYRYVTEELPSIANVELPLTGKQSIFGHSMGGHGALICFLKNPGLYASVSAFSPICHPSACPWGKKAFTGYLGEDEKAWEAYDATSLLASYEGPQTEILIDQGAEDEFLTGKQLLPEDLVAAAEKKNFPVNYRLQDGYDHSYWFIQSFIEDHIQHHAKHLNA